MATFGNRFKELRIKQGKTQEELAKDFNAKFNYNYGKSAISQYENNKRIPEMNALQSWASYFNVTTDYLLGREEEKQSSSKTELSKRVKKEITEELKKFEESLMNADGLMLDGEIVSEETVQNLLSAMKIGMEIARQKNKEKFTPKKYRK